MQKMKNAPQRKKVDSRYTIGKEFTGHESGKPRFVVRFLNERLGCYDTLKAAKDSLIFHGNAKAKIIK